VTVFLPTRVSMTISPPSHPIALHGHPGHAYRAKLIGSILREYLDHIVVLGGAHVRRILRSYAGYHNNIRTHRSFDKHAPAVRPVQRAGSIRRAHPRRTPSPLPLGLGFRYIQPITMVSRCRRRSTEYSIGWSATQTLVPSGVELLEIDTRGRNAKWTGTDERDRAMAEHTAQAIPPSRAAAYTERGRSSFRAVLLRGRPGSK
jgi:hypothetical protein